jgi:hypothetical protein
MAKKSNRTAKKTAPATSVSQNAKYPRHSVTRALRIPQAIIEQNAGRECSDRDSANYVGVGFNGHFKVEISSALKYGFLARPKPGFIEVTDRARQAIRPQKPGDEIEALRQAIISAPELGEVYAHYRGEYLPDDSFLSHALEDKFGVPADKVEDFVEVLLSSLESAKLVEQKDGKYRLVDISANVDASASALEASRSKLFGSTSKSLAGDSCFVVMPFALPIGDYYQKIYEPAIQKAGLRPVRADAELFGTGKIIDQIWSGINSAKILVAELTNRTPNVFYELGLAHALNKPVVLVSSNEGDVPFDLKHIRVIYYDMNDPFWGQKLIDKVAENIVSAIKNPEEALFGRALTPNA